MSRARKTKIARDRAQGEFALIDAFLGPFGVSRDGHNFGGSSGVLLGPGDDCAQLNVSRGTILLATTDAAFDGVHFELGRSTPEDAGWKALAINLSDLAAAGAKPRWFLCALGVPKPATTAAARGAIDIARGFATGMSALAKQAGCALVGGNVSRAAQWSITITALGEAKKPLSRAGAKPGDLLFLIGELGAAALGLKLLQQQPLRKLVDRQPSRKSLLGAAERSAVQAQLRPTPQLDAGQFAAKLASAAIDVSDGLLQDLGHLCERSHCSAAIDCDALPRSNAVRAAEAEAAKSGAHPYALSLAGGEDYALLVAVPPKRAAQFLKRLPSAKQIGRLTDRLPLGTIDLFDQDRAIPLPARPGHDHLA